MNKERGIDLAWAGGIVALSLVAACARTAGFISEELMLRTVAMNGLALAYYGNRAPKAVPPSVCASRQVTRFSGWAMVLSGLLYAGLWAFAPLPIAMTVGTGAVAAGVAATFGYSYWLRGGTHA